MDRNLIIGKSKGKGKMQEQYADWLDSPCQHLTRFTAQTSWTRVVGPRLTIYVNASPWGLVVPLCLIDLLLSPFLYPLPLQTTVLTFVDLSIAISRSQLTCSRWWEGLPSFYTALIGQMAFYRRISSIMFPASCLLHATGIGRLMGIWDVVYGPCPYPPEWLTAVVKVDRRWRLVSLFYSLVITHGFVSWLLTSTPGCSSWTLLMVVRVLDVT